MVVSRRTARHYESAALASNALHFGSDLFGSLAVLVGLVFAYYGYQNGDPIAALFVGVLVLLAAARLIKAQRRRADGSRARGGRGRRPRRDRRAAADGRAAPDPDAPGGRPPVRRHRDRSLRRPRPSGRATQPRTPSRLRSNERSRRPTSSCTSSRSRTRPCASARTPRLSRYRAFARCTTSSLVDVDGRTELSLHVKLPARSVA